MEIGGGDDEVEPQNHTHYDILALLKNTVCK